MELKLDTVNKAAKDVASGTLAPGQVIDVRSEITSDSRGRDALLLTVVLSDDIGGEVTGAGALNFRVRIRDQLLQLGEKRSPIIEFSLKSELSPDDRADP